MAGRARAIGRIRVLTLAAVVLAVTTGALPTQSPNAHAAPLAAGSDFTITSAISSSATSANQPALLHLGVTRYLWYTVSNPLSAADHRHRPGHRARRRPDLLPDRQPGPR